MDRKHIGESCRMSDEENKEGSDRPVLATTDFNDDGFVFYVHQRPGGEA